MRLIDADALEERFADSYNGCAGECECCKHYLPEKWRKGWCGLIANAPTVATDTNVLGKWIRLTGMAPPEHHGHKICSVCKCLAPYDPIHQWREMLSPYCPSCGAKMEVQNEAD